MADTRFELIIDANGKPAVKEINKITKATKGAEKEVSSLGKKLSALRPAAAATAATAMASLGAAAVVSVKAFADFENQLASVKTLLNENSFGAKGLEAGFADLQKEVLELSKRTPAALDSLNKSLFDTVSAGVDAGKAVKFLGTASKLAVAGITDVAVATDGLTSAVNAYGLEADEADSVASKFFSAQKFGKTTIEELSSGFGLVGASASSFGVDLNELLSAVSAVTLAGVKTNAAYTGMKAVLANVAKPTADAAKEAKRLGIEFNAAALRSKGLSGFLDQLVTNANFTKDSITKLFGSTEAQNIIFALTAENAGKFKGILEELNDEQKTLTTFTDASNTQLNTTKNQMALVAKQYEAASIELGEKLVPLTKELTKAFAELVKSPVFKGTISLATEFFSGVASGIEAISHAVRSVPRKDLKEVNKELAELQAHKDKYGLKTNVARLQFEAQLLPLLKKKAEAEKRINEIRKERGLTPESFKKSPLEQDSFTGPPLPAKAAAPEAFVGPPEQTDAQIAAEAAKIAAQEKELSQKADFENKKQELEQQGAIFSAGLSEQQIQEALVRQETANVLRAEQDVIAKAEQLEAEGKHKEAMLLLEEEAEKKRKRVLKARLKVDQAFSAQRVSVAKNTAALLVEILGRESKAAFLIGKAVAVTDVILADSKARASATAAAAAASVGAAAGGPIAAAAAYGSTLAAMNTLISVNTGLQLATIAASTIKGFAEGGLAMGGISGRDSIPAMLQPGELVVPERNFEEVVGAVQTARGNEEGGGAMEVMIGFTDSAFEIIEEKILERRAIGVGAL